MIVSDGRIVGDFGKVCPLVRLLSRFAGITFTTVRRTDGDHAQRHRRAMPGKIFQIIAPVAPLYDKPR